MAEHESTAAPGSEAGVETPATPATSQAVEPQAEDSIYEEASHLLEEGLDNSAASATPSPAPESPGSTGQANRSADKATTPESPESPDPPKADDWDPLSEQAQAEKQETDAPSTGTSQAPKLTEDQTRLLSRLHMQPEQLAGWTPQQRDEFLANAAKRETDQTSSFTELKNELHRLRKLVEKGSDDDQETGAADDSGDASAESEDLDGLIEEAISNYGPEIKPVADLVVKLNKQVVAANKQLESSKEALEQQSKRNDFLSHMLSEQAVDFAIRDLVSDYPSLDKADASDKVKARFDELWRSDTNPHRKAGGSVMDQIRRTMKDAASAEFGNVTESAAQVALANKTKERLQSQPQAGKGRERPTPLSEEDIYDKAFQEHLKPDL